MTLTERAVHAVQALTSQQKRVWMVQGQPAGVAAAAVVASGGLLASDLLLQHHCQTQLQ